MQKIALIADSSCDLDKKTIEKHGIRLLPIRLIYKDKEYLDKINITSEEMYASISREIPTTSLPDVEYTDKVINKIKEDGYTHVIVITVSKELSGTFNSVRVISEHHPELKFHLFDTKTLGYPQGAIVLEAVKMLDKGMNCEEILEKLQEVRKRVHGYVTVSSLEYMIKGGRIGRVAGTIGEILHLKPIISSNEHGLLYAYAKARGRKQAISKLKDTLMKYLDNSKCRIWVLSGDALEEAQDFYNKIKNHPNVTEISLETIGPAMGVHTGPGSLGLCILEEE